VGTSGACKQDRKPSSQLDSSPIPGTPAPDKQIADDSNFARDDIVKIFGEEVEVDTFDDDGEHIGVLHSKTVHFNIHSKYLKPIACTEHTGESHAQRFKKGETAEIHGLPGKVVIEKNKAVTINIGGVHVNVELPHVQLDMDRKHTVETIHLLRTSDATKKLDAMAYVNDFVQSLSSTYQQEQERNEDHNGAAAGASATTTPGLAR